MSPQADDALCFRDALRQIVEIGMDVLRAVRDQVTAPDPEPAVVLEAAKAYDLASRAVRRTILLAQHLDEAPKRDAARKRILREVEDAINRCPSDPVDKQELEAELRERLDSPDLDDEIGHRPVPDIIKDICRDLGLGVTLGIGYGKRRTPEDIATLGALAARPANDPLTNHPFHPIRYPNTG
jgi:hypothetical protein